MDFADHNVLPEVVFGFVVVLLCCRFCCDGCDFILFFSFVTVQLCFHFCSSRSNPSNVSQGHEGSRHEVIWSDDAEHGSCAIAATAPVTVLPLGDGIFRLH